MPDRLFTRKCDCPISFTAMGVSVSEAPSLEELDDDSRGASGGAVSAGALIMPLTSGLSGVNHDCGGGGTENGGSGIDDCEPLA